MVYSVEEVAQKLGLKKEPGRKVEWHGPNPIGKGATEDGFILYPEGNAWDRRAEQNYTSKEVAEMAGLKDDEYQPCVDYKEQNRSSGGRASITLLPSVKTKKEPKVYNSKSLQERGIAQETLDRFMVEKIENLYYRYPTFLANGGNGRHRYKICNPVAYAEMLSLKYGKKQRPSKYQWEPRSPYQIPSVYGIDLINGQERVIIVNGEVSVWTCHQAGLIAVSGFSETVKHKELIDDLIQNGVKHVVIALDNDDSGHLASAKLSTYAKQKNLVVEVVNIMGKSGKDVADIYEDCEFNNEKFIEAINSLPQVGPELLQSWEDGLVEVSEEEAARLSKEIEKTSSGTPSEDKVDKSTKLVNLVLPPF